MSRMCTSCLLNIHNLIITGHHDRIRICTFLFSSSLAANTRLVNELSPILKYLYDIYNSMTIISIH